jgi:hypothetical protein
MVATAILRIVNQIFMFLGVLDFFIFLMSKWKGEQGSFSLLILFWKDFEAINFPTRPFQKDVILSF